MALNEIIRCTFQNSVQIFFLNEGDSKKRVWKEEQTTSPIINCISHYALEHMQLTGEDQ